MNQPRASTGDVATAYSLTLLYEYTHTLDSLPIDLSRNFADLRELDAVLSSSMASITAKIQNLTKMIEEGTVRKEERLWLLTEISEEAIRLKPGGEDKIRVACQAADHLKAHTSHLRALAENVPGFDANLLERRTTYPHVALKTFMPAAAFESRRGGRRTQQQLQAQQPVEQPSPVKRKRNIDDVDRSPRKEKPEGTARRGGAGGRARKVERQPSVESTVSVTSHRPPQSYREQTSSNQTVGRGGNTTANGNKRRTTANNRAVSPSPLDPSYPAGYDASRRDAPYNVPPISTSHPSLLSFPHGYDYGPGVANGAMPGGDWNALGQLGGPGVPVPRNRTPYSAAGSAPIVAPTDSGATEAGDGEGDGNDEVDDKVYCICQGPSHGEMVGCDDSHCENEWFHLTCLGLTALPKGDWYCDNCKAKRNAKRPTRGNKRRAGGGGRASGR